LYITFENYFKRKVDLLTPSSLKNPYLIKQIENTKILVYHGEESEIIN
jgi:predicted nucleotidyltransferase